MAGCGENSNSAVWHYFANIRLQFCKKVPVGRFKGKHIDLSDVDGNDVLVKDRDVFFTVDIGVYSGSVVFYIKVKIDGTQTVECWSKT